MKIVSIPIGMIQVRDRGRPVNEAVAERLAEDIGKRGLRQPIEVARVARTDNYILVSGGHRLEACRLAGLAKIPASVIHGNQLDLRRDELMENLARSDLSKLERAQFLFELKSIHRDMTGANHGGDRKSIEFKDKNQESKLDSWYREVAVRSNHGAGTIKRATEIGEKLSRTAADRLRGTAFEDNQKELEALSRRPREEQPRIAEILTRDKDPAASVRAAVRLLDGHVEPDLSPEEKALEKLKDAWNRAPDKARRRFIDFLKVSKAI